MNQFYKINRCYLNSWEQLGESGTLAEKTLLLDEAVENFCSNFNATLFDLIGVLTAQHIH